MTSDALRPAPALSEPLVDRLRAICLALPAVVENERWGDPTFRVRGRISGSFWLIERICRVRDAGAARAYLIARARS